MVAPASGARSVFPGPVRAPRFRTSRPWVIAWTWIGASSCAGAARGPAPMAVGAGTDVPGAVPVVVPGVPVVVVVVSAGAVVVVVSSGAGVVVVVVPSVAGGVVVVGSPPAGGSARAASVAAAGSGVQVAVTTQVRLSPAARGNGASPVAGSMATGTSSHTRPVNAQAPPAGSAGSVAGSRPRR